MYSNQNILINFLAIIIDHPVGSEFNFNSYFCKLKSSATFVEHMRSSRFTPDIVFFLTLYLIFRNVRHFTDFFWF